MDQKKDITSRLNRIAGQIRGIQRMVDEEATCVDVLTQIAAVRSAINKVGGIILERYTKECIQKSFSEGNQQQEIDQLSDTIQKFLKYVD